VQFRDSRHSQQAVKIVRVFARVGGRICLRIWPVCAGQSGFSKNLLFSNHLIHNIFPCKIDKVQGANDKCIDIPFLKRNITNIRVAARFFSGVPHPHLLGVCCPNFLFPVATEIFPRKP
jgi:hypothetical protein